MADPQDDKSRLPLAGILALLAMVSGALIYEGTLLKTARPVDKEAANNVFLGKGLVQARLWQDPLEAVETYRLQADKEQKEPDSKDAAETLATLVNVIGQLGVKSGLRVLPVFMDGSPYANGVQFRLKDRYAVVSALGAAGYVPESGETIRVFRWYRGKTLETEASSLLIPAELFIPKEKLRDREYGKPVLVVWLKDQDFGLLDKLLSHLDEAFSQSVPQIEPVYSVLGPRSSASLSAMLKELQHIQSSPLANPPFSTLKHLKFYSPSATAEDTFLLDYSPSPTSGSQAGKKTVDELFEYPRIEFIRTIKTDAQLAEQLIQELRRRRVDLKSCPEKDCNPKVALISEWDTLYGRSLPRTFAAVAMNNGSGETGPALEARINELRRDEWPGWITPHSYLAGLDGELPTKESDQKKAGASASPAKGMAWFGGGQQDGDQYAGPRPEGRSQLDYVLRLAAALKQEETRSGEEFKAIGVLGSDVYDKLLLLQALRPTFPRALFFTTDLNARLAYPGQWQFTRNLIVASHFGQELQPALQTPIPPFRDSYQTSLFYSALWALEHFQSPPGTDYFQLSMGEDSSRKFSRNAAPRLYEIGRYGAFDISTDGNPPSADYASIHAPRPDLEAYADKWRNLKWAGGAVLSAIVLLLIAMLISSTVADASLRLVSNKLFWLGLAVAGAASYGLTAFLMWMMPNAAENEPFTLTEGISAWPTEAIRLLALVMSSLFLWYSWYKLKSNAVILARGFNLEDSDSPPAGKLDCQPPGPGLSMWSLRRSVGIHNWRPQAAGQIDAAHLWREYIALGAFPDFIMRGTPQVALALLFAFLIMALFGFPNTPCRGAACFELNGFIIISSVAMMLVLIFYVVDATRLCRRWVECVVTKKIRWPDSTLERIAMERGRGIGTGKENLDEWLGIELIAERTTVIGNFIYFPFIIMFLLGISRHSYLDNWGFPTALVIIFTLNAILVVVNAMALRHSAEMARGEAIGQLEKKRMELSDQTPDEEKQKQQIEWAIEAIRSNQRGAFLPFTKHPVFGAAIALPSGGYGLVLLLEYLATSF